MEYYKNHDHTKNGAQGFPRAVALSAALFAFYCIFIVGRASGERVRVEDEGKRRVDGTNPAARQVGARETNARQAAPSTTSQPARAQGAAAPDPAGIDPAMRMEMRRAVDLGLRFIAKRQNLADGSFLYDSSEAMENRGPYATAALAALAFMADGNSETRGPYAHHLKRAIDYLLDKAAFDEDDREVYLGADGDNLSRMHGHGYAALALAQVLGMGGQAHGRERFERIKKTLTAAVRKIESTQGTSGGWYYTPSRNNDHEGSVTITLVQALRAAKEAGITVNSNVIKRAVEYVRKSQKQLPSDPDHGSFRYRIGSNDSSVALTVAAISTLNATGDYDSEIIEIAMQYIQKELKNRRKFGEDRSLQKFPGYELLYLAQAFRQYRDPSVFEAWYPGEVSRILKRQKIREDATTREEIGYWQDPYGLVLGTAISVIVLRTEDSYLPILER